MANYPHLRFYPGPDLLLKDAIEKEAKSSISQALLVSDKARFQAQQIKRRALFRRAGLKVSQLKFQLISLSRHLEQVHVF